MSTPDSSLDPFSLEKTYKLGSSNYYAYLFVAEPAKSFIAALYALHHELNQVLLINSDSGIARIKLAWWRNEIDRLFIDKPEHPLTQSLHKSPLFKPLEQRFFQQMVDAVEMDLDQNRYMQWSELEEYCQLQSASLASLVAQTLGVHETEDLALVQELGKLIQLSQHIRRIGEDARQGRIYFPINTLQEFELRAADLLNGQYSDIFVRFIQAQADSVRERFSRVLKQLRPSLRKQLRPCLIKVHHSLTLLRVLEQDHWQILHQRTNLNPIRKLLIAAKVWLRGGYGLPEH